MIRTSFGFESTAAEVVEGLDLAGKRAIVTGAASGIGVETARALAGAGAAVTLAVRRTGDAEEVAAGIRASTGNDEVAVARLELTDPASVAAFVAAWDGALDILVNNAGVMAIQELTLTDRGTRCSSRPTISATSPSRSASTTRWPRPGPLASSRSAPVATCARR